MRRIWKYEVEPNSAKDDVHRIKLKVPFGARPLTVQIQDGKACLWVEVDEKAPLEQFVLFCVGTGFGIPPNPPAQYLATIVQGAYVWHFYW